MQKDYILIIISCNVTNLLPKIDIAQNFTLCTAQNLYVQTFCTLQTFYIMQRFFSQVLSGQYKFPNFLFRFNLRSGNLFDGS